MDRHAEMTAFLAVVEDRSLAAAARRLNLSVPTVTRAIGALESRLGVALLARSTRGVQLTEAGERFAPDCARIVLDVAEAERSAAGLHAQPRGLLTLAAPLLFGQHLLMPILLDYLEQYPDVQIAGQFMDRVPNLHEEAVDVAVLAGELPDSSLFAIKVGSIRCVVCASPAYLAAHGEPATPAALVGHRIVHSLADARLPEWRFLQDGAPLTVGFRPRLTCATNQAAIVAASRGAGLTRCMSYQIAGQVTVGELKLVLTAYETSVMAVHVVYREGRKAAARVRSFVDFAVARLRADTRINPA
jgi:DNA-binding transcriptional LysR family regulator